MKDASTDDTFMLIYTSCALDRTSAMEVEVEARQSEKMR